MVSATMMNLYFWKYKPHKNTFMVSEAFLSKINKPIEAEITTETLLEYLGISAAKFQKALNRLVNGEGNMNCTVQIGEMSFQFFAESLDEEITGTAVLIPASKHQNDDFLDQIETIINQSPAAVAMFNKDIEYIAASSKWYKDYGLKDQSIVGKSHYEIFPEIGDDWKQIHQEALQGIINRNEKAHFPREDGSSQWLMWDVRPWYTVNQEVGGILMLTADITEEVIAKEKLQESEAKFRASFESSGIGMAIVGTDGNWLQVNDQLASISGYSIDEITEKNFMDLTHPDDLEVSLAEMEQLISGDMNKLLTEKRYINKAGDIVWAYLAVSLVRDRENNPLYFVVQITDISALKETQKQLNHTIDTLSKKNNVLQQFAYIASHDLNEPINSIQSMINLIAYDHTNQNYSNYPQ